LAAQETRVIRVGIKVPTTDNEKTYRLFIKEKERKSSAGKTGISILVNFGVPIFSQPLKTLEKGEVASAQLDNGDLNLRIKNTGNLSFQIKEIAITGIGTTGTETYRETLNGWYLLAGAERTYKAKINHDDCLQTNRIDTMILLPLILPRAEIDFLPIDSIYKHKVSDCHAASRACNTSHLGGSEDVRGKSFAACPA
jgi:fimbrial chaperone protein